jgi:spermidine synthase
MIAVSPYFQGLLVLIVMLVTLSAFGEPAATGSVAAPCDAQNVLARLRPSGQQNVTGDLPRLTDEEIDTEGAAWDALTAVTFTDSGSITYDLGEARSLSAVFIQADANDVYRLAGSLDGQPGSFRPIAELANVVERGHGLRGRTVEFAPQTLRFLRVSDGPGDGSFSIAELAAYCRAPSPFPAAFKLAAKDSEASSKAASGPQPGLGPAEEPARMPLLAIAALLAALGFVGARARAGAAADAGKSPAAPGKEGARPDAEARASLEAALRVMFFFSGCAALIYEVVWFHLMRLVIGASALSVGIVLASFMGGMFLGSFLFPRYVTAARHPLRVYAWLELGIGAFGLAMPLLLPAIRYVYVGLVGYGSLGIALRSIIAAIMLLPPTALMGATLPAIARRYAGGRRGMAGLAWLYTANTAGAVAGCLLSAFYLLAVWDVWVATCTAVALNLSIGAYGLWVAKTAPVLAVPSVERGRPRVHRSEPSRLDVRAVYVVAALSGFTSLGAQVLWTRLLTLLFGATVFAFAIILAVFLAGLGIGSALAAYLLKRGQSAARGLGWTQLLLAPTLFLAGLVVARYLPFASPPAATPVSALHGLHVVRAMVVMLPSAVLWGMSFPLALAAASSSAKDTGRSSAYVYAANTVGAIAGSLTISFWIIPSYGSGWATKLIALGAGVSAAILMTAMARASESSKRARERPQLRPSWALANGVLAAALVPSLSIVFLAHGRYIWWVDGRDRFPYVSEGAASTVAVHVGPNGYRNFHVSGRVEATDNPSDLRTERLIGHLSGLPHPHPESVLVVGMGGGISAGALSLYPEVKRIVICEIEPRVVGATRLFADENYHVLDDPRVEVVFDDARHFLATTREKFDVITSDPIHPWVRGNSILFSEEYYNIVRQRLKPGGLATQWVPLYETSELAIKIQMRTFIAAFPHGTVWNTAITGKGYDVVLVGGERPLRIDLDDMERRIQENPKLFASLAQVKIRSATDLVANYGANGDDMQKWLAGVPVNRDFSLKLEYISGLALNAGEADPIYAHMVAGRAFPNVVGNAARVAELRHRLGGGG